MSLSAASGPVFSPAQIVDAATSNTPATALGQITVNAVANAVQEALRAPTPEERAEMQQAQAEKRAQEQRDAEMAQQRQTEALMLAQRAENGVDGAKAGMKGSELMEAGAQLEAADSAAKSTGVTQVDDLEVAGARSAVASRNASGSLLVGSEFAGMAPAISHPDMDRIIPLRKHLMTLDMDTADGPALTGQIDGPAVRERNGRPEADVAIIWKDGSVTCVSGMPLRSSERNERPEQDSPVYRLAERRRAANAGAPAALAA